MRHCDRGVLLISSLYFHEPGFVTHEAGETSVDRPNTAPPPCGPHRFPPAGHEQLNPRLASIFTSASVTASHGCQLRHQKLPASALSVALMPLKLMFEACTAYGPL